MTLDETSRASLTCGAYKNIVSLGLTFHSSIMISVGTAIEKNFLIKFGLVVKGSRSTPIHQVCKPGRANIANATYQAQGGWPFGSREEDILRVVYLK